MKVLSRQVSKEKGNVMLRAVFNWLSKANVIIKLFCGLYFFWFYDWFDSMNSLFPSQSKRSKCHDLSQTTFSPIIYIFFISVFLETYFRIKTSDKKKRRLDLSEIIFKL